MTRNKTSFSLTATDGEKRCAIWTCYAGSRTKNDFYLSCRELPGVLKVSFHETGDWRIAYTSEFWSGMGASESRILDRWERPAEFYPGMTLAYYIYFPSGAATIPLTNDGDKRLLRALPSAPPGMSIEVCLLVVASAAALSDAMVKDFLRHPIGSFDLANGDRVVAMSRVISGTGAQFQPDFGQPGWFAETSSFSLPKGMIRHLVLSSGDNGERFVIDRPVDELLRTRIEAHPVGRRLGA